MMTSEIITSWVLSTLENYIMTFTSTFLIINIQRKRMVMPKKGHVARKSSLPSTSVTNSEEGNQEMSLIVVGAAEAQLISVQAAPIVSSYNDKIRPLLDCVDKLRHLKIMQEGIQLPTIVVIGDQSSGKSSVLESLASISLPRGQGICTRVPLIMRLQSHEEPNAQLFLEFNGKIVPTDENNISDAINRATEEIAGSGKGISNIPLTLIVKKVGVPDLTMVDLPGITRVPVHGQPEDIYEQISAIMKEYITPKESIILNVLSASVDFTTCESIRMSQKVDRSGERTLAVVTKADRAPEGLLEKITADDVNIGLGYVCVRNRIGTEIYEEAREEEARLFESHHLLSRIPSSMVGIPVLAQKLVHIQANIISKCLPDIISKIDSKLDANVTDLNRLPRDMTSVADAMAAFVHILGEAKESLRKVLLRGEFDEYPDDKNMHCTARLAEMLNQYSDLLQANCVENDNRENFLTEEIRVLEETKGIGLPNFLPRTAFLTILQRKVKLISMMPVAFVESLWNYIEGIVVPILMLHSDNYPQLLTSTRRSAKNLIAKKLQQSKEWVAETIAMEKLADYTCNPEYVSTWNKLMAQQNAFMAILNDPNKPSKIVLEGFGEVEIGHLRNYLVIVQQAFDMKMRIAAYWKIVLRILVDAMALHMLYSINNLVNDEMEREIVAELMSPHGGGIERMLEESPAVADKRSRLKRSIKLLKESKDVVSNIMVKVASYGD